jgi:hypothetical protein
VHIVVNELAIEDALGRARQRFRQSDERLCAALGESARGLPWMALGALAALGASLALMGLLPLSADAARAAGIPLLLLGGALLGYGVPVWTQARRLIGRRKREWQHALQVLGLREEQAAQHPTLSVEVLERGRGGPSKPFADWHSAAGAGTRYLQ